MVHYCPRACMGLDGSRLYW